MKKNIITLSELVADGKMIAFIKGNRSVNSKNISKKKTSFEKFGMNLVPLMYVEGQKAIDDGCVLIHPITRKEIPKEEAYKYVAIIEGQNRYVAAKEKGLGEDNLYLYECYSDENIKKILAETNIVVEPWNGLDYANGAVLFNPENQLAQFAKELADLSYPISTIGYIACFASGKLGKSAYSNLIAGKDIKVEYDVIRAKCFLEAARKRFGDGFISKRYLVSVVVDLSTKYGYKTVCKAVEQIPEDTIKRVLKAKADDKQPILKASLEGILENRN